MKAALAGLCGAAIALAGCGERPEYEEARQAAAGKFAYPSGVKFRNLHMASISSRDNPIVCGEANGRGVRGEESGWRRFSYMRGFDAQVEGMLDPAIEGEMAESLARVQDGLIDSGCNF